MARLARALGTLLVCLSVVAPPRAAASTASVRRGFDLQPPGSRRAPRVAAVASGTVPYFHSSFSYQGTNYGYYMVGSNPRTSTARTVVGDVIVPLRFVFSNGSVLNGATKVASLESSPLFHSASFSSGATQFGDAIQRAEFWKFTKGTHYHVLLASPSVLPTQTIDVPATDGYTDLMNGVKIGVVLDSFLGHQIRSIERTSISPGELAIFYSFNIQTYDGNTADGFSIGFHGAFANTSGSAVWTYAWSSWWTTSGSVPQLDTEPISHEIAEWYNNPFAGIPSIDNVVPRWKAGGYPCNPYLEVGDPVAKHVFKVNGYHLQDEAFFSWFARQTPSIGINGRYTYLGSFSSPPPVC